MFILFRGWVELSHMVFTCSQILCPYLSGLRVVLLGLVDLNPDRSFSSIFFGCLSAQGWSLFVGVSFDCKSVGSGVGILLSLFLVSVGSRSAVVFLWSPTIAVGANSSNSLSHSRCISSSRLGFFTLVFPFIFRRRRGSRIRGACPIGSPQGLNSLSLPSFCQDSC